MSIEILDASAEYLPQIHAIEKQSFPDPWTPQQLSAYLTAPGRVLLVAVEDDEVLGYLCLDYVLDEGSVSNIAVAPRHRGRGVGKKLLHAAETAARDFNLAFLTLEVRQSNLAAIVLYERAGFEHIGIRKKYYVNPRENAVIMTKNL